MKSRRRRANRRAAAAQPVTPPPAVDDAAPATTDAPAAPAGSRPAQAVVAPEPATDDPITDRWFWIGALVVFVVAALIRLPELGINPFHHDEGVNGWFTTTLARSGSYQYDPANYHGPTLYYFALASEILFGLTNEAMRLVPVVFGLVTVGAVLALRPILGSIPVLVAGLLLALSPGAVYVSRYFIHEALLVAFTMTLVASALLYLRSRNPVWALGVGASAALIFATKETGVITVVVLAIAAVVSGIYVNWRTGGTAGARRGAPHARRARRARRSPRRPSGSTASSTARCPTARASRCWTASSRVGSPRTTSRRRRSCSCASTSCSSRRSSRTSRRASSTRSRRSRSGPRPVARRRSRRSSNTSSGWPPPTPRS